MAYPGLILKMYKHRVVQQTYLGIVNKVGIWNVIECKYIFYFNSQGSREPFDGSSSGWSWESSLGEKTLGTRRTETGNQVVSFMLKSCLLKLICSRLSHH